MGLSPTRVGDAVIGQSPAEGSLLRWPAIYLHLWGSRIEVSQACGQQKFDSVEGPGDTVCSPERRLHSARVNVAGAKITIANRPAAGRCKGRLQRPGLGVRGAAGNEGSGSS